MDVPRNLISDSSLVQETFELIRDRGGRAAATEIVDSVFRLSHADQSLAASLVADLLGNDPRFKISDGCVEIVHDDLEHRPLGEIEFVVMDVEAMVAPPLPPRIIELGAYRVRSGMIHDEFQTLINPELPVPRFITSLTGITDEVLSHAPRFAEITDKWLQFAGDAVIAAHNSGFDLPLLNREVARVFPGHRMRNAELCTVKLARRMIPELAGHNLDSLAEHFAIPIAQRHRAACDALATAQILIRLLAQLEERGVRTLAEARSFRVNGARNCPTDS
jgi:DNA polymerase III epsilon subunit family exonuclease